ncbi:galactose-1-phosphate uridylyltransferase [Acetivibrio straminisolvens]|jgi:UDPglucose--hexose-1-phosphate uridylyltransferase|uniref:galactose-1-phosphate uridylyltransferase n=1 Tax=Acetivibrio straminisolvens TaxID=253314 RepID=UPI002240AA64|nr:galactose-1-phosphate uridylyltransferase [Acetivibrio straminisolvens]
MSELRWNPLIRDWVIIAPKRQGRPDVPKDWCPFCPGSGKVPESYDVLCYDNDFPSLAKDACMEEGYEGERYRRETAYGKCEVVLYSREHTKSLWELPQEQIEKLVNLWIQRFNALKEDKRIKYIYMFENRGEMVGATIPHPHGQIYAYPFIPKRIELELESCREYQKRSNSCLICDMLKTETESRRRVVTENKDFSAFVPSFSECPYEVYIVSKKHRKSLVEFDEDEKSNFARILKEVTGAYDALFNFRFPYMMCMHQSPVNCDGYGEHYHFHVEFYSPLRSEFSQKYNAAGETGAWAHVNPTQPEEKAEELRRAYIRFKDNTR